MKKTALSQAEIKSIIPHREPMLLIDEVEEIIEGSSIKAKFFVDPVREIFKGHFPGEPVLPGVYTVECMAQASDILLLSMERYAGKIPYFIGIDKVKFMKKIEPGDTIEIHSNILNEKADKAIVTCCSKVFNKGELAATGEVTLAMR
ncbi:3-hydroxyacyl-ACP dehydratase FabZ [Clostridiales bacterium BAD-6]|uniref:3-hydroxyacyl-ACP dehydratase FabZ n=2 Tax=Sinanaerobacter chloroacetimidivorans TaxID=2818044 RepID=A0A8J8B317_9FIRM|nr:3-hydroxyacyl-ACP dehydratase FabZ [Sinanaerobacter chloroacetimidivorans]